MIVDVCAKFDYKRSVEMPQDNETMTFRPGKDLRDRIRQAAEEDHRTMSEELTVLIEWGFRARDRYKELERQAVEGVAREPDKEE